MRTIDNEGIGHSVTARQPRSSTMIEIRKPILIGWLIPVFVVEIDVIGWVLI